MRSTHFDPRNERPTSSLLRVRDMAGFRFGSRRTDIRGWDVFSRDVLPVGVVSGLMADIQSRRIRYLLVQLPTPNTSRPADTVLVPIGLARRPDDGSIIVIDIAATALADAPRVSTRRPVTRADERAALHAFGVPDADAAMEARDVGATFDDAVIAAE